jgi:DNA mismatch repair ATPase MutS
MILEQYQTLEHQYAQEQSAVQQRINQVAFLRLLMVLGVAYCLYAYYNAQDIQFILIAIVGVIAFVRLLLIHLKLKEKAQLCALLKTTNTNEIAYLNGDLRPFATGKNRIETVHPYSHDLDIFGETSIFQHINRTTTSLGEEQLALWLNDAEDIDIIKQQKSVQELSMKLNWRQNYLASGQLFIDEKPDLTGFQRWLDRPLNYANNRVLRIVSYVLPAITVALVIADLMIDEPIYGRLLKLFFFLNLIIVATQKKNIKDERELLTDRDNSLKKYSALLQVIENENFTSEQLVELKQKAAHEGVAPSVAIKKLARILNQFDIILNPIAAILMNGLFQYHIHALYALDNWKSRHNQNVMQWFKTIGTFEALSSIANFAYNHPDFSTPILSDTIEFDVQDIGHPLIPFGKRICNDIVFRDTKFVVLTGSNMSGKSTFLRTLGVNLILAKMGSPVCANRFVFYPFHLFVSMRVNDSLQNDESFFFAELKRLQQIIGELDKPRRTFIILDEILRGTNSNDKRAGTQGLIKKLITKQSIGIIATHDLVISEMKQDYPDYLSNQCFEAEIINDELRFDYKLREGVCQQMSAAFLMEKMGIIE